MLRSLASRFTLASLFLLPLILGLAGYGLQHAFEQSLLSGERERLKTQIYLILAAADIIDNELWMPEALQEPRFSQLNSGLYATITNSSHQVLWRSESAKLLPINNLISSSPIIPGSTGFNPLNQKNNPLFVFHQDIAWEIDEKKSELFRVTILHSQTEFNAEKKAYINQLWQWLGLLAMLLLVVQTVILRWGLQPLKKLAKELKKVENGEHNTLEGDYPTEIQRVTTNLNNVLRSEQQQRTRYRNTLDDLAHSLKTPLSVINSTIQEERTDKQLIGEQVQRMNDIVGHQLQRAVAGYTQGLGEAIGVSIITDRIINTLKKVYAEKKIAVQLDINENCFFYGDERDLFEMLGNILENAFKYGNNKIIVSAKISQKHLVINVEDDGKGVSNDKKAVVLQRGARADTATLGQGIGLAVAVDIISSYEGSLEIKDSSLGGANFEIQLPLPT